tara:strand:+ start:45 stop:1523 length:1479 start_codon:yes stop_codon:yes gene_type:complete
MAEETEQTPTTVTEPRPLTVEERNKPILDVMGQQATGVTDLGVDPASGITPSLGSGEYKPVQQTVGTGEDIDTTGKLLSTDVSIPTDQAVDSVDVITPENVGADQIQNVEKTVGKIGTVEGITGTLSTDAQINAIDVTDAKTKDEMMSSGTLATAATQELAQEATVQYQLGKIMDSLQTGSEMPSWASGALRTVKSIMNKRGLNDSSMASAAMVQALVETALPIAAADAQAYSKIQLQNLTNEQQTVLSNAATMASLNMKNLDNRLQAAKVNAESFLRMDLQNANNAQVSAHLSYQKQTEGLFKDQSEINLSKRINAQFKNEIDKFYDQLKTTVDTNNSNRAAATDQFNVDQMNSMAKYEEKLEDAREKFNTNMRLQIDQSNAVWRRGINTANTAAENTANQINAASLLGLTVASQNNLWQKYRDEANYSYTSSENDAQRALQLALTSIGNQFASKMFDKKMEYEDTKASGALLANFVDAALDVGKSYLVKK